MVGYYSILKAEYDTYEDDGADGVEDGDEYYGYYLPSSSSSFYYTTADNVIFIITRYGGLISLLSAICVLIETYTDIRIMRRRTTTTAANPTQKKKKRGGGGKSDKNGGCGTRTRLLFTNMIAHCLYDIALVFANLPAPTNMQYPPQSPPGSHGTIVTCEIQGFIFYVGGVSLLMYDMAISITYVSIVRYNIQECVLQKFEYIWHIMTISFALSFSISALIVNAYNYDFGVCGIETYPPIDVVEVDGDDHTSYEYIRGSKQQVDIFDWIYYTLIMLVSIVSIISMTLIYNHTRQIEKRNQRYFSGKLGMTAAGKYSREVGLQGLLYSSTFIISCGPLTVQSIIYDSTGRRSNEWIVTIVWLLACLHSFFYLLFFMRNREMKTKYGSILKLIFYDWFCCSCRKCHSSSSSSSSSSSCCCCCCCHQETNIIIKDDDGNNNNNNNDHYQYQVVQVVVAPDPQQIDSHCKVVEEIKSSNCCCAPIDTFEEDSDDDDNDDGDGDDDDDEEEEEEDAAAAAADDDDAIKTECNATTATTNTTTTKDNGAPV